MDELANMLNQSLQLNDIDHLTNILSKVKVFDQEENRLVLTKNMQKIEYCTTYKIIDAQFIDYLNTVNNYYLQNINFDLDIYEEEIKHKIVVIHHILKNFYKEFLEYQDYYGSLECLYGAYQLIAEIINFEDYMPGCSNDEDEAYLNLMENLLDEKESYNSNEEYMARF
tara:strand:+ start:970 stop:1476 length:507 start_codon:yes stop_codon:yes gene_type:complete